MLRYAAANRDGAKFACPHQLDVERGNAGAHLAFGAGIHHCLGAQLARYEMIASFEALLARLDNLPLDQLLTTRYQRLVSTGRFREG
jgi:cytochrome P450